MYSMMMERECKGEYFMKGGFQKFEDGIFLGFGIDFEEFDSGAVQFTTAIVELKDGTVVVTTPDKIQFLRRRPADVQTVPPLGSALDAIIPDNKMPSDTPKGAERKKQEPKGAKEKKRKKIDYGKIMALRNAGWDNAKIADEMHMTKASVATAISTYKKKCAGGVMHDLFKLWTDSKKRKEQRTGLWAGML